MALTGVGSSLGSVSLIRPVILSGGSGTRLWPLSTSSLPKQFAPLLDDSTLFERTLNRLPPGGRVGPPLLVVGESHAPHVHAGLEATGIDPELVILEPKGRNTAPAALAAALSVSPDEILVILPSDHLIADEASFGLAVRRAAEVAGQDWLVTFGIDPESPETGYGYIERGEPLEGHDGAFLVRRFKEKPDREEAVRLVADGRHLWNSGMFVAEAGVLIAEADRHCPAILSGVQSSLGPMEDGRLRLAETFEGVEAESLDYAIMERTARAAVIPIDVGWDDLGSYQALWKVSPKDAAENAVEGRVVLHDVSRSFVRSTGRVVAVAGLEDVVVVETPEAILVTSRERSQMVRDLVERMEGL